MLSSVDFPEPEGPIRLTYSPIGDGERHLAQRMHRLVANLEYPADARELDHGLGSMAGLGLRLRLDQGAGLHAGALQRQHYSLARLQARA